MPSKKYFTDAERRAAEVRSTQKYRKSQKGQVVLQVYYKTDQYKQQSRENSSKYEQSIHGKKHRKEFQESDARKNILHKYDTSEKGRQTKKLWKKNNPEKVKSSALKWCKIFRNSESGSQWMVQYRIDNKEILLEQAKIWAKNNPKRILESRKKSLKILGDVLDLDMMEVKAALQAWSESIREDYPKCPCGKKSEHAHHCWPKEFFPENALDLNNGLGVCIKCHKEIHKILKKMDKLY